MLIDVNTACPKIVHAVLYAAVNTLHIFEKFIQFQMLPYRVNSSANFPS